MAHPNVKLLFVFMTKEYRRVDEPRRAYSAQLAWSIPNSFDTQNFDFELEFLNS